MTGENHTPVSLDPSRLVGELVAERPARARLFERLHIDYCCNGQQTLAKACADAGAQVQTTLAALETLDDLDASNADPELTDWRGAGTEQLCDHIVATHHEYLRRAFPRIDTLVNTVVRVHGSYDDSLSEVQSAFQRVRAVFEPHLGVEETELFPAILAAEQGGTPVSEEVLAEHEREHAEVGVALESLNRLCHGYDPESAHCNTHRSMLDALEELEHDVHRHVHEENNVLFQRARAHRAPALAQAGSLAAQAS